MSYFVDYRLLNSIYCRNKPFKSCDGGCDYSCPPPAVKKIPEESECEVLGRELLEALRANDNVVDQKVIALFGKLEIFHGFKVLSKI